MTLFNEFYNEHLKEVDVPIKTLGKPVTSKDLEYLEEVLDDSYAVMDYSRIRQIAIESAKLKDSKVLKKCFKTGLIFDNEDIINFIKARNYWILNEYINYQYHLQRSKDNLSIDIPNCVREMFYQSMYSGDKSRFCFSPHDWKLREPVLPELFKYCFRVYNTILSSHPEYKERFYNEYFNKFTLATRENISCIKYLILHKSYFEKVFYLNLTNTIQTETEIHPSLFEDPILYNFCLDQVEKHPEKYDILTEKWNLFTQLYTPALEKVLPYDIAKYCVIRYIYPSTPQLGPELV
jgi:hypothetical protein